MDSTFRSRLAAVALGLLALAPVATGQKAKLGNDYFEDHQNGYRFQYPDRWNIVPVKESRAEAGILCDMDGPALATRLGGSKTFGNVPLTLFVLKLEDKSATTTGDDREGLGKRVQRETGREDVPDVLKRMFSSMRDFEPDKPDLDEQKKFKDFTAHHRTWHAFTGRYDVLFDSWKFHMLNFDVALIYTVPEQHEKKWTKVFELSAKSFSEMDIERALTVGEDASYEDLLAFHEQDASRTPGWRALPTPSAKYIIKTSSDDEKFIKEVIERLERSRELFERDFPPSRDFDHVSVVRLCRTADEFHSYGGTGGGVAGWFNPGTTELVLYDAKEYDRNMTYAVMSHEAFHQYCHFLFEQSEAHRWFDEGHGDYYGGAKFRGKRVEIEKQMPGGLDRLTQIRQMVRDESFAPLAEHLNFNHQQWQQQGPSGVSCYSQSWSIIYMLREGTLGNVSRRMWKDEYADIIPNYVSALYEGFQAKFAKILEERKKKAEEEGEELAEEDLEVTREDLEEEDKEEIWKAAIEASWGQIDLEEFEANWLQFVEKSL